MIIVSSPIVINCKFFSYSNCKSSTSIHSKWYIFIFELLKEIGLLIFQKLCHCVMYKTIVLDKVCSFSWVKAIFSYFNVIQLTRIINKFLSMQNYFVHSFRENGQDMNYYKQDQALFYFLEIKIFIQKFNLSFEFHFIQLTD